ncbi:hypothetical protein BC629DRAFT_1590755 [Irpex lacteus]|nr:hypothetical protein BC629DRAFT_1590755 [Irpex lacteus]
MGRPLQRGLVHSNRAFWSFRLHAAYLSDSRLQGSHIDQLVACTQEALNEKSHRNSQYITGPDLVADIVRASQDTPENLVNPQQYGALRRLEFDLVNGHRKGLGAIAFINRNHYTFVVLDTHEEYLGYADSMGNLMPEDLRRGFLWWISRLHQQGMPQHRNSPVDQWVRGMPVAPQAVYDDFSCGMLASSRTALSLERIEAFNTVCRTHLDAKPEPLEDPVIGFAELSMKAAFSFSVAHGSDRKQNSSLTEDLNHENPGPQAAAGSDSSDPTHPSSMPMKLDHHLKKPRQAGDITSRGSPGPSEATPPTGTGTSLFASCPPQLIKTSLQVRLTRKSDSLLKKPAPHVVNPLFAKFKPITREELQEANQLERIAKDERRSELMEKEERAKLAKKEREREGNRIRKQKERERKRQRADDEPSEKPSKKLQEHDGTHKALEDLRREVAEDSRPYRQVKKEQHAAKTEPRGRKMKPENVPGNEKARRVHWMNPLLFRQIDTIARATGYPWSPKEIVSRLRASNPVFELLSPHRDIRVERHNDQ